MNRLRRAALLTACALAVVACSKSAPAPSAASQSQSDEVPPAPRTGPHGMPLDPNLVATRSFVCDIGGGFALRDYDDRTTRIDVAGVTHSLTPVNIDAGTLLQDGEVSVQILNGFAAVSEKGVVLFSGCKPAA